MGLFAVARLAERHGVRVRLRAGNPQGLTALVWLPDSLAERGQQYGDLPQRLAAFEARRTPGQHATPAVPGGPGTPAAPAVPASPAFPAIASRAASGQPDAYAQDPRTATGPSYALQGAGPAMGQTGGQAVGQATGSATGSGPPAGPGASNWFRNRPGAPTGPGSDAGEAYGGPAGSYLPAESAWSPGEGGWASGQQAAQMVANPVRGDRTVAGMPVRVPSANLVPGSADGGQRTASYSAGGYDGQASASAPLPQRSAETARSRLSGFQRGARRAEDQASHAEMRSDR
jgi:hypothetical protein